MKISKVKSLLLMLSAVLLIAMFTTSCGQEEIITDDQLQEVTLQERNPCFLGNSAEDCYACYEWLNDQDRIAMESQIDNCQSGDCEECTKNAIEWYQQALGSNAEYLVDCLSGFDEDDCDDCYTDFMYLTKQDVFAMGSQVSNCIQQGGDCEECKDNAVEWYSEHASTTNIEFLQDCLEECNGIVGGGGCEDSCDDICRLSPGSIRQYNGPDPCTLRFSNWGSSVYHPCQITDRNWTAENGTVTEFAGGLFSQITFNGSGTYEVCVDVIASNGNESCCSSVCTTVTISDGC